MTQSNLNLARTPTHGRGRIASVLLMAAIMGGVVATGYALAQTADLDTNADGMISYSEILVAMPDMTQEEFLALDADADGLLSQTEVAAAQDAGLIPAG
ncbi:MAG: hypothetical protein AAF376_16420 [Pseudomonadota bacterium]